MHATLAQYTVHLHPLAANTLLTAVGGREDIERLFPNAQVIDYITPGVSLAAAIKAGGETEQVIFLINHGVIFSTTEYAAMLPLIEKTLARFEYLAAVASLRIGDHARVNSLASALERLMGAPCMLYLCEDAEIAVRMEGLLNLRPTFPDAVVYCGAAVLHMPDLDVCALRLFVQAHGMPKLIVMQDRLYIADTSLRKCREIEAVLKSILLLQDPDRPRAFLDAAEVQFLNNWDAEKYRRQLKI
jgi:hypothetical protein